MRDYDVSAEARAWFLSSVQPRARRRCSRLWHFGPLTDLEEVQAEAVALAWKRVARHWRTIPLTRGAAVHVAYCAAAEAVMGKRLAGRARRRDVIDGPEYRSSDRGPCNRRVTDITLLDNVPDTRHAGPAELAILRADWQAFSRSMTPTERRAAAFLADGRYIYQIAVELGVCTDTLTNWRRDWWRAWRALNPDVAHYRFVSPGNPHLAPQP